MLVNHLFESGYGAAAGVETIRQLLHAVKDSKDIDLKVGPEMFPIEYGDARYLLSFFKANRHLGDGIAEKFGDANWVEQKLAKRDAAQSPDRLNKFDLERMAHKDREKAYEGYKGWEYSSYDEDYGDVMKKSHVAKKDGKEVSIDWSPYDKMSDEQFKTWVDLGMPTRKDVNSIGPLSPEDLEQLMKTKLGTKARLVKEEKCPCCGDEIVNGKCGCGPECPHCGGKPHVKEGTWHIPDTPELVQGLNKWFKQDRPVGKNAELIQKSLGAFIGDDGLYDDLEAVAKVSPNIDGRSLVMTWINDHMPEIADAMQGKTGFVMYEDSGNYVDLDDSTDKYWNKQGKYSKEYEKLHNELVPGMGKADTIEGEVLRAASKIYYRHFNDGDSFTPASFDQLKPFIGPVSSYDDLAEKAVLFALNAKGNYRPNEHWDSLERMDYGSEYEDDADWDDEGEDKVNEYDSHNVGKGQYSDFEVMRAIKVAQDYHDDMTHAIEKIDAIKPGLSNHRAVKDELRKQNEDKKDDITKKIDPKTRIALKKQQMKTAGVTKGDPVAAMAMGLEKDVDRLDKENDEEEADIAAQAMVDKFHTQELDALKKMVDNLLRK